jgi:DNA-binding NarL/FixJ family response regulator
VAIQDRRRLYREALSLVVTAEPDLEIVASTATGGDLLRLTAGIPLDIAILELDASEWDPYRLVGALLQRHPRLFVIGTRAAGEPRPTFRSQQAGVRAVFSRHAGVRTLLETVRSPPDSAPSPRHERVIDLTERRPMLSPREIEVLAEIGAGATTRAVAESLGISAKTVEHHKQRIFTKLGVQNQAHAVALAIRMGLLSPTVRKEGSQ